MVLNLGIGVINFSFIRKVLFLVPSSRKGLPVLIADHDQWASEDVFH